MFIYFVFLKDLKGVYINVLYLIGVFLYYDIVDFEIWI